MLFELSLINSLQSIQEEALQLVRQKSNQQRICSKAEQIKVNRTVTVIDCSVKIINVHRQIKLQIQYREHCEEIKQTQNQEGLIMQQDFNWVTVRLSFDIETIFHCYE